MSLQPIIKSISEKYDISKIPTDILDKIIDEEIEAVSSILKENLGILRRDMPQVDSNNLKKAIDLVKRNAGVKHEMVSVGILKKTQKNMIPAKVSAIANKTTNPTKIKPVIISSDNHIVDGHHRWAAVLQKYGEDQRIPVYRIDKPIKDALNLYASVASALNEMLNEYGALLHYVSLTPVEFKKFSQNYKKLHSDNKVGVDKKENMYYGYRKGSKYFHWKYDADKYELHFEHSKYQQQVLGLLNWFDKYKDSHIWGESFIVENKKSDEIWKRFKPQITALIDNIQNQFGIHPSITAVLLTTIINKNFSSKYKIPSTWKASNVGKDLPEAVTETIKNIDGKYVVYPTSGGERLGTHDTKSAAQKQLAAIEISKHKNEGLFTTDNALKPYEKLLVAAIVEFMRSKYNISSKIIVRKKQSNNMFGDIVLNDNTLNKDKFYLHFNPNASHAFIIQSIIHELIHVKQISRGELRPSSDYKELLWKGKSAILVSDYKKFQRSDYNEYKKLPWEAEAYGGMKPLYREFLKSKQFQALTGQDANLDYIISSLTEIRMVGEDITIPINIGDTVLGGKFKNKRIIVKSIDKNEKGDITINGKPLLKYRLVSETAAPNHLVEGMYDPVNIRKYYEALCKVEGVTPLPVKFETVGKGGASLTYNPKTMKPLYISFDVKRLSDPEFAIIHELTHQIKLETESDAYVGKRDQSAKFKKLENRLIDKYVYSNYSKLLYEFLNEIPMGDLVQIDKYADKQLDPVDVVLTDKHFFDRLTDPRNQKDISQSELIRFFKQLSKRKSEFLEVLEKYREIVVTDNKTNINIPFMKQANKAIAKTIMRKAGFKTPSPHLKFENKI